MQKNFILCLIAVCLSALSFTAISDDNDEVIFFQKDDPQPQTKPHYQPQAVQPVHTQDSEIEATELPAVVVHAKSNCHREALYPGVTVDPIYGTNNSTNDQDMQNMGVFAHDAEGHQIMVMGASYTADHKQLWYQTRCTHPQN